MLSLSHNDPLHNQRLLQTAIDEAKGGGRVVVPAGVYPCGGLELKSGVELHLGHGARLIACDLPEAFPPMGAHDEKLTANAAFGALVQARGAHDIAITGSGTLDGGGTPESTPDWASAQKRFRPAIGYFEGCTGVTIEGPRIVNCKWWTLHLLRCEDIMIRGVRMRNTWPNSDGIDPDGCKRMVISDCTLDCGDDCIVLKSTRGDDCEDIVISNCVLTSTCAALKLGTESRGGFRNITMTNCVVRANVGFGLYMKDGGVMENVLASQIVFETESDFPVLIDATPRDYRTGAAGQIRNVRLHNCVVRGGGRVWLGGTPRQPLENISLTEIDWFVPRPLAGKLDPRPLGSARTIPDPERPAYEQHCAHVLAVHVRGLRLEHLRLAGDAGDRELLWSENVETA